VRAECGHTGRTLLAVPALLALAAPACGSQVQSSTGGVQKLISVNRVAAVFGGWTSASRKAMLPVFERGRSLLSTTRLVGQRLREDP
jgi:hypothetical protein